MTDGFLPILVSATFLQSALTEELANCNQWVTESENARNEDRLCTLVDKSTQ